jgi:hypothetical protein
MHLVLVTTPGGDPLVAFLVSYSGPLERGDRVTRPAGIRLTAVEPIRGR